MPLNTPTHTHTHTHTYNIYIYLYIYILYTDCIYNTHTQYICQTRIYTYTHSHSLAGSSCLSGLFLARNNSNNDQMLRPQVTHLHRQDYVLTSTIWQLGKEILKNVHFNCCVKNLKSKANHLALIEVISRVSCGSSCERHFLLLTSSHSVSRGEVSVEAILSGVGGGRTSEGTARLASPVGRRETVLSMPTWGGWALGSRRWPLGAAVLRLPTVCHLNQKGRGHSLLLNYQKNA